MVQQKVRADLILYAIQKRHTKDLFITEVKDGPTWSGEHRRLDAIAIKKSWTHPCITGYEVKVSRKDFQRDEKWPGYRDMCHKLFFACPAGLIQTEELPNDVGLIWYNSEKQTIQTKKTAIFRDIEIPGLMLYYLLIARTDSDRHPFFSSRREYLEAWIQDKAERRALGYHVGSKMAKRLQELERQVSDLKVMLREDEVARQYVSQVKEIMRRAGVDVGYYWLQDLEKALNAGIHPGLSRSINSIDRELQRLKTFVNQSTETA